MSDISRNQAAALTALLAALLVIVGVTASRVPAMPGSRHLTIRDQPATNPMPRRTVIGPSLQAGTEAPITDVLVHVAGAVKSPGVYRLPSTGRVNDAMKAAGGPKANANTDAVNLAAHLQDGTRIYFPTTGQQPAGTNPDPGGSGSAHASTGKSGKLTDPSQGQIDIGSADAAELQRVPGIGPAMAERILEARQHSQGFRTLEDIRHISGIGAKKFERMKPFLTVH